MTQATLRTKLQQLAEAVADDGLSITGTENIKEKTTALKTAADVYALLHKQDASGKGESAYDGYRRQLAETTPHERKAGNGTTRRAYRNAEAGEQ